MASGKLGSADLGAGGADTLLFTAGVTPQTFNVRFANRNAVAVKVRVAIGSGASAAAADYVDYDVSIVANGILEDTGLVASSGEKVWVRSDTANVSVRAHGM
jgi:hypothetical protein